MSKLAWYVVIMVVIDVLLCLARFVVKAEKSTKKDDAPSEGSATQETETTPVSSEGSANPPSA